MAYFAHAYQKIMIGNSLKTTVGSLTDLTAGQLGVVGMNHKTIKITDVTTASYATHPMVYLAQGSFHTVDEVGMHSGYLRPVKSKGINPKYVSKVWVSDAKDAQNNIWHVCSDNCNLECETTYRLRIDIKGSPVLRTLTRNMYFTVDAYTGCCDDPDNPSAVDPNVVLLQWADRINEYPLTSPFVNAFVINNPVEVEVSYEEASTLVTDDATVVPVKGQVVVGEGIPVGAYIGNVTPVGEAPITAYEFTVVDVDGNLLEIADNYDDSVELYTIIDSETYVPATTSADVADIVSCLVVTGAYVDTKFGNCSYSKNDRVDIEPVIIKVSILDETGDPCVVNCFKPTEIQEAHQGAGYGETLLQEYILSKSYEQEFWEDDPRYRETKDQTFNTDVDRTAKYKVLNILHSVPRKSNPSGTFDNDQYLIRILFKSIFDNSALITWLNAYLTSANSGIQVETTGY